MDTEILAAVAPHPPSAPDHVKGDAFDKFIHWCRQIGYKKSEDLFAVSTTSSTCSVCNEIVESSESVTVHLHLLTPTDKHHTHGSGADLKSAQSVACSKALALLEAFDPEIFTLRRKRLRVRLEDFGITLPKTDNMLLLEGEKEEGLEGLPESFTNLMGALIPDEDHELDESNIAVLSEIFLHAIPQISNADIEAIFNKIGLSFCDEMNAGMNVWLFTSMVSLILRLNLDALANDEKLKLSFSKVMEQVVIFNADLYPGSKPIVARIIRYLASNRALPFMSKNRLESVAVMWSPKSANALFPDVDLITRLNERALQAIVAEKTPPKEYLDSLFFEFSKINTVIRELFGVDGAIYGSLVNGFPTSSSDIDVVINLPQDESSETGSMAEDNSDDEQDGSPTSTKCLKELNRLHDAIKEKYGDEFSVSKIESARVPILIIKKGDKIEINLSFNHEVVIHNSALLRAYSSISPRVRELVVLVKHWAKKREINDALQGSLSSYSYVLLVIAFLQNDDLLPDLQNPPIEVFPKRPLPERITDNGRCSTWFFEDGMEGIRYADVFAQYTQRLNAKPLAELLATMFDFYLYDVNYVTDLVCVSRSIKGRIFSNEDIKTVTLESNMKEHLFVTKRQYFRNDKNKLDIRGLRKRTWLAIADPFEIGRVLGTSARGMETITKEMKRALALLHEGFAPEIFTEYNRRDRVQLPPFPFRALSKKDPVDMTGITKSGGLRMQFTNNWDQLIDVLSLLDKSQQIDIPTFRCFCYMNRLGLPSERELEDWGLVKSNRLTLPSRRGAHAVPKPKIHEPKHKAPVVGMVEQGAKSRPRGGSMEGQVNKPKGSPGTMDGQVSKSRTASGTMEGQVSKSKAPSGTIDSQRSGQSTIASARKELLKHHPDQAVVKEFVTNQPQSVGNKKGPKKSNNKPNNPKAPVMTGKQIGTM